MIQSIDSFIKYFGGVRRRTINFIRAVPPDQVDWSPKEGELTCGDIIRHLAATEKMYVDLVVEGRWGYAGHGRSLAADWDEVVAYLEEGHNETISRLRALDDGQLNRPRPSLGGHPLKVWRWLMLMVEHEVHHRSQLAVYLTLMGVEPPQIFGLGFEDIVELAGRANQ